MVNACATRRGRVVTSGQGRWGDFGAVMCVAVGVLHGARGALGAQQFTTVTEMQQRLYLCNFASSQACPDSTNTDVKDWDVSRVVDLTALLDGTIGTNNGHLTKFNADISGWNTASATSFNQMFTRTEAFNQDISRWNTAKVENMSRMFERSSVFNQDISSWNVDAVTDMSFMFANAVNFDKDIRNWNPSFLISDMGQMGMFSGATAWNAKYTSTRTANTDYGPPCLFAANGCGAAGGSDSSELSKAQIAGVAVGCIAFAVILILIVCIRRRNAQNAGLRQTIATQQQQPQVIVVKQ